MTNLIFIGKTYYHASSSHGSHSVSATIVLLILLIILYLTYAAFVCTSRRFGELKRKKFIIYLLIPFSWWFVDFVKLFEKD